MILFCCHPQINKLQGEIASARCMVTMHVPGWFYFQDWVSICNPEEALISGGGSRSINHLQALKDSPMNRYLLPLHQELQVPMLVLGMCTNGRGDAVWYVCGTHNCIFQNLGSATGNSATVFFLLSLIFCISTFHFVPIYTTHFIPFALSPASGISASLN